jgi:hypothetical protein
MTIDAVILISAAIFVCSELFGGFHRHTAILTNFCFHILYIYKIRGCKGISKTNAGIFFATKPGKKETEWLILATDRQEDNKTRQIEK